MCIYAYFLRSIFVNIIRNRHDYCTTAGLVITAADDILARGIVDSGKSWVPSWAKNCLSSYIDHLPGLVVALVL